MTGVVVSALDIALTTNSCGSAQARSLRASSLYRRHLPPVELHALCFDGSAVTQDLVAKVVVLLCEVRRDAALHDSLLSIGDFELHAGAEAYRRGDARKRRESASNDL